MRLSRSILLFLTIALYGDAPDQAADKVAKIKAACGVSDSETNPAKLNKASACVEQAIRALNRQASVERALSVIAGAPPPQPGPLKRAAVAGTGNQGASSSGTSSTC